MKRITVTPRTIECARAQPVRLRDDTVAVAAGTKLASHD
jgi:hypothetical protein